MADNNAIRVGTKIDLSGLKKGIKEVEKELSEAQKKYNDLEKHYADQTAKYKKRIAQGGADGSQAKKDMLAFQKDMGDALDKAFADVEKYNQKLQEATSYYERFSGATDASAQVDKAMANDKFVSSITTQEKYNSLLHQTRAEMARIEAHAARISAETGASVNDILRQNDAYQDASNRARLLETRSKEIAKNIKRAKHETKELGKASKASVLGFGKMGLALMAVRFAMRAISAATREYMAVNTELEGQMNTLKALWGQVLGPAIEWVINLLIKAISAVNAFVYALTGINLVAKANAAALKKQADAAGGGNQTAGFDEQTKLSGGSGSENAVATLPDGTSMDLSFLDPMMEALRKFKEDISPLIETMGNLFKWLWEEVLVPLGDWILNSWFPAWLDQLGACLLVVNDALLALQPMALWIWENFLEPIASWTGGVILDVITGIGNWIREHHETLGKVVAAIAAVLIAVEAVSFAMSALTVVMGLLTSPVTWIIAAITGLVVLFVEMYDSCEGFRAGIDQAFTAIKDIFFASIEFIKALFEGDWAGMDAAWAKIVTAGEDLWEGLWSGLQAGWTWIKEKLTGLWEKVTKAFCDFFGIHSPSTLFEDFGKYMMEGLVKGIKGALSKVTDACREIWTEIKKVFASVGTWFQDTFRNAWQKVKDVFSSGGKIFNGIKDGIASTFKTIVNGLITGINKVIATPFNSINGMLNTIRGISILGVTPFKNLWSYNPLSIPQIPKLALGGIVNRPGRGVPAIIGEAGAEAVLPLENNTEWMDILAEKIGGNVTIPIYMDGKKIYTYIVDIGKRKAFAANGG